MNDIIELIPPFTKNDESKIFNLKCNIDFFAKDLQDALNKLENHFKKLQNNEMSNLIIGGEIYLEVKE